MLSIFKQVQLSENAMFLIDLNVIFRLTDLLEDRDPIIREKVCIILRHLGNYYQGRIRILSQPIVVERLMFIFLRDRKEIRYAAAECIKCLTTCRRGREVFSKNNFIIENLLRVVKNEHVGIIILHLQTLKNLTDFEPTKALKANAFQIMWELMKHDDPRVIIAAMECMRQLCKHSIGKKLSDKHDLTKFLLPYLYSENLNILIATVGLMEYTSITTMSKWRIKEFAYELSRRLTTLAVTKDVPALQLRVMQVMINMCDCPDFKMFIRKNLETKILHHLRIRKPEQWDGTTRTKRHGYDMGHYYRTRSIWNEESIKVDLGDNDDHINVKTYLERVVETKKRLIQKMYMEPYKD